MVLTSKTAVTLLGASKAKTHDIDEALSRAPFLVAADGGAATALAMGLTPQAVIGDFDSLPKSVRDALPPDILFPVAEQESTDFEKSLRMIDAPLILAVGFTGRRLDHELAVYNALARNPDKRIIIVGRQDIVFLAPTRLSLDLPEDSRLSLFPMGAVTGTSSGLAWPIDGLKFAPDGRIGTSNRVNGPVELEFDTPAMLAIMPRVALDEAMRALTSG
ncbi:MAG: thiamine diphosphokinase [Rhodobacteraceae bacterium]|nr:thiamine diphosphokinase [Alphaproteobacteria bacterium]MBT8474726.1 thiamine diphosphokinase [Alphaproteobacteria bacterium]NNK65133.1 thiamine diphosphokinase [Paracoccaceae bacterium]